MELGGFDQAYDPAYFEDVDLCLRLRAAGWTIVYEPSAVVVHHRSMSTREDLVWREFAFERSQAVFSEHWGPLLPNAARLDDPPVVLMPVTPRLWIASTGLIRAGGRKHQCRSARREATA